MSKRKVVVHSVHDLGNSCGITLPMSWIREHNIKPKDKLKIRLQGEGLLIEPPKK